MRSRWSTAALLFFASLTSLLAGCGMGTPAVSTVAPASVPTLTGSVHGGQQPVSGATIQLYEANVTGANLASKPLISTSVTTNAGGFFTITGTFTVQALPHWYTSPRQAETPAWRQGRTTAASR